MADRTEIAEAIRIADKHLAGASAERRLALASDISKAMILSGGEIARGILNRMKAASIARAQSEDARKKGE